jgi:type IV pilus assembly protein PilA
MVELLAVIAMVGILAAVATVGYRRYINGAQIADAKATIGAIRIAEESYRSETMSYLDCPGGWYPNAGVPDHRRHHWHQPTHADYNCWRQLNVVNDSPTKYTFRLSAGRAGDGTGGVLAAAWDVPPVFPATPNEAWYVVEGIGDVDEDGIQSRLVSGSFSGEIYVENSDE